MWGPSSSTSDREMSALTERSKAKSHLRRAIGDRLDRAEGHTLQCRDYMHYTDTGANDAILCKVCGAVIVSLVPVGKLSDKVVATTLAPTSTYKTVTLEMDDGTAHQTPLCVRCAKSVDAEQLLDLYMADLETMLDLEDNKGGGEVAWEQMDRTPLRVGRIE